MYVLYSIVHVYYNRCDNRSYWRQFSFAIVICLTHKQYKILIYSICYIVVFLVSVRRCFCQGHCPFGKETGTCELKSRGVCFASAEAIYDSETEMFEPVMTSGCLADGEGSIMQVSNSHKNITNSKHKVHVVLS